MSTTTGLKYDQVFELATQLSKEEQDRLIRELPNASLPPYCREKYLEFLLRGPVFDEASIQLMQEAREEINKCQPISW